MNAPSPALTLYGLAAWAVSPLAPAWLRARAEAGKEDRARLGERLGHASLPRLDGRLVWLHGVSVGESLSLLGLAERLRAERPDGLVLITSGTRASADVLVPRLPTGVVHQYCPIDTPGAVGRFLDHWRPDLGVLAESELWPNLILGARRRGVRLALVSGRISPGSLGRWLWAPAAARAILGACELVLARDAAAAGRFAALGARVDGLADLKFAAAPLPADETELARLRSAIGGRPVILAASTHPGEEATILDRFGAVARDAPARPLLILAPRHIDRGPEVERLALDRGFAAARRNAGAGPAGSAVYVADTVGELGLWYRVAGLAVLGGSLIGGVGGHNPLEPARLGCPFVAGAHVETWPVYDEFEARGATGRVARAEDLDGYFRAAIEAPDRLTAMADAARDYVAMRDAEAGEAISRILGLLAA